MPTDDPAIIGVYRVSVYIEDIDGVEVVHSPQQQLSTTAPNPLTTTSNESVER